MGGLPAFTEADFKLSKEKRAEITAGLTPRQAFMVNQWMDLHDTINKGDWDGMDAFFDTSKMTYDNPNRPDLGTYFPGRPRRRACIKPSRLRSIAP